MYFSAPAVKAALWVIMLHMKPDMKKAVSVIRDFFPNLIAVYLFGSGARDALKKESDLDIALLPSSPTDRLKRWECAETIARAYNRDVDLVDLSEADTVMRFEIISGASRIFCTDTAAAEQFEDKVYYEMIELNELRLPIRETVKKSGKVYGWTA